jgi:hypothetical protein
MLPVTPLEKCLYVCLFVCANVCVCVFDFSKNKLRFQFNIFKFEVLLDLNTLNK